MKFVILDYIKKINKEDINKFARLHSIDLNNNELNNLYNILKDPNLLNYSDYEYKYIINNNVESYNSDKVYNLLMQYKKKYHNYL